MPAPYLLIALLFLGLHTVAADDLAEKPACSARRSGEFWPIAANRSQQNFYQSSHDGRLEVCTYGTYHGWYRYHWEPLTVSYPDLLKETKDKQSRRHANTSTGGMGSDSQEATAQRP